MRWQGWLLPRGFVLLGLGCGSSGPSPDPQQPLPRADETPMPAPPQCETLDPTGSLASFDGVPCGWTLRAQTGAEVEFTHATAPPSMVPGELPERCAEQPCRFRGVQTRLGPLIVAEAVGVEADVPRGVWLGYVRDEELQFVDLWADAGEAVIDDGVSIGPPHALTPFDCEGALVLLVRPRLAGAQDISAPPMLHEREGVLVGSGEVIDPMRCEELAVELP